MDRARVLRASLIAPLVAPLLYFLGTFGTAVIDPVRRPELAHNLWFGIAVAFAFGAPVAYLATALMAVPALWVIRQQYGALTGVRTTLVGAVVGGIVAVVLAPQLRAELISVPLAPWSGAALGGASAAVWWLLATRRGPGSEPRATPLC